MSIHTSFLLQYRDLLDKVEYGNQVKKKKNQSHNFCWYDGKVPYKNITTYKNKNMSQARYN